MPRRPAAVVGAADVAPDAAPELDAGAAVGRDAGVAAGWAEAGGFAPGVAGSDFGPPQPIASASAPDAAVTTNRDRFVTGILLRSRAFPSCA